MEVVNKKLVLVVIIIGIVLSIFIWQNISDKETKLEKVVLKNDETDSNMFAIMLEQEDGTYKEYESDIWPQKENGYLLNEEMSGCMDAMGNTLSNSIAWNNNIIKLKTIEASYCYLYFDLKKDYCIENGITNLGDCLLVSENYSETKEEAIAYINKKGEVDTTAIAPTTTYAEKKSTQTNENGIISTSDQFTFGSSYTFDTTTGFYTLKNYVNDTISDEYIDYYTCGGSVSTYNVCSNMYKIKDYLITSSSQKVTEAEIYSSSVLDSFDSEVGLYKTTDGDGDTYFYRGAVKNNYVSYAGFIWRVVRINGNGSIRMIYSGTSTSATGVNASIGKSAYNSKYWDPTYVGYKYGEDLVQRETTKLATNKNFKSSYVYYYGEGFIPTSDGKFQLDQTKTIKSGKWSEAHEDVIANTPYTCLSTSQTDTCMVMIHLKEYVNASSAKVYYISNNSKDYASTLTNTTDSTIKMKIDSWYESNIKGKMDSNGTLLSDYLSDELFCNDRSIHSGTGYLLSNHTFYGAFNRINQMKPSLLCSQDSDKFSVANGNLTYPIGLITADEALLAGSVENSANKKFYLYTGTSYWTMSSALFSIELVNGYVWRISSSGELNPWHSISSVLDVRPVINLSSDVLISRGIGTADNPYIVEL